MTLKIKVKGIDEYQLSGLKRLNLTRNIFTQLFSTQENTADVILKGLTNDEVPKEKSSF